MSYNLNRRDVLKLAGLASLGVAMPGLVRSALARQGLPNVLIVVFDAFSAYDASLYGYTRPTTPNIDRLAQRAVVYHNHFAGGNYTTPGTASLLTGVLPWTHRALNLNNPVAGPYVGKNIFTAFENYYRIAYTHNGFANLFLEQFVSDIDELIPKDSLYLESYDSFISSLFKHDDDVATVSWVRSMRVNESGSAYSLFLSHLYETLQQRRMERLTPLFPRGIPTISSVHPYLLETATEFTARRLAEIPQPFAGYFHFMPPHHPYRTSHEFFNAFKQDGFRPLEKPVDLLAKKVDRDQALKRTEYDEFILYCDREFARLYESLEAAGLLENTWLVLTSDHGEMFERGITGHGANVLYQPVVRIPLLIFEPGRQDRLDVYEYTSAVDVLPTLTHIAGRPVADWTEGAVLPPYAGAEHRQNRSVYVVQAIDNSPSQPLTQASTVFVRENYKLHYYFGYPQAPEGIVKLFDIKSDPEEMTDLSASKRSVTAELLEALKGKLAEVNRPYL